MNSSIAPYSGGGYAIYIQILPSSLSPPLGQFSQFYTPPSPPPSFPSASGLRYPLQNMQIPPEMGPSYMEPVRSSVCPPNGHPIAFWRSKLEFILVLRRFRAPLPPFPPPSPFGRFLVSPFHRRRPRPRLPFLRPIPMQPTMQRVWVGSPAPFLSSSPRDMQSGWIYPLKSERPPRLPAESVSRRLAAPSEGESRCCIAF